MSSLVKLVRKKEFRARLNIGNTKFWQLQKAGLIPPPVRLPGLNGTPGRTCFWPNSTVDAVVDALAGSPTGAQVLELAVKHDPFSRLAAAHAIDPTHFSTGKTRQLGRRSSSPRGG